MAKLIVICKTEIEVHDNAQAQFLAKYINDKPNQYPTAGEWGLGDFTDVTDTYSAEVE